MKKLHYNGPVVLAIMDGVGLRTARSGNAFRQAHTEFLDQCLVKYLNIPLEASGEAVGIMPGQMGNSEVGHNAIGSGQIIKQGIAQIESAFQTGAVWDSKAWRGAMQFLGVAETVPKVVSDTTAADKLSARRAKLLSSQTAPTLSSISVYQSKGVPTKEHTLHFAGIFSDGGVHSDIKYLEQMIQRAYDEGVRKIRVHAIFDGRDVAPQSEPKYIERLEKFCKKFKDVDFRIASGGGREATVADRYGNNWGMVESGWKMMVRGEAPREFRSATEAIKTLRRENPGIQDQYLPEFVIVENTAASSALGARADRAKASSASTKHGARPVGPVEDGDAFIYYDFRADRAVEIAEAFTQADFDKFKRGRLPKIYFAGLTEYDSDRHIPEHVLVPSVKIDTTLNKFLGQQKISQLAVSETAKFGHVTYYFNGNSYKTAPREKHIEIATTTQAFDIHPWMESMEITDVVIENLDQYQFIRLNFPNGDMVGHFADLEAGIIAMEAIDLQLRRLAKAVDQLGGMMIITADHGNIEELLDRNGVPKTSHTSNPVPCIFYDNTRNRNMYQRVEIKKPGLANLASTITTLLGFTDYPAPWQPPLITTK